MAERQFPVIDDPRRDPQQDDWYIRIRRAPTDMRVIRFPSQEDAEAAIGGLEQAMEILLPDKPERPDHGSIMEPMRDGEAWVVKWSQKGVPQQMSLGSELAAEALRVELTKLVGVEGVRKLPSDFDGDPDQWHDLIVDAARALNEAVVAGDKDAIILIRQYSAGLISLAAAVAVPAIPKSPADTVGRLLQDLLARPIEVSEPPKPTHGRRLRRHNISTREQVLDADAEPSAR